MNGQNTNSQRRQALKKILAGSSILGASAVVPNRWVKPVVNAVVLPAHAQPSPAIMLPLNATWAGGGGITSLEPRSEEGLVQRLLDQMVPEARAQDNMSIAACPNSVFVCLDTLKVGPGEVHVLLYVDGAVVGDANAEAVNRAFEKKIADYMVTGRLSPDDEMWDGEVDGPCVVPNGMIPIPNGKNNVNRNEVFTGERINMAAQQVAVADYNFEPLSVRYTATRNTPCSIAR